MIQSPTTTRVAEQSTSFPRPDVLNGLNERQREAVLAVEGPVLVQAGAGSGKTRVLISRIAHLVLNHAVDPGAILGITFTRKAAGEMRERLAHALGVEEAAKVSLLTFHSLGVKLLREYGSAVGLGGRMGIADETDAGVRLRTVLRMLGVPRTAPGETPREVQERISKAKATFADQAARAAMLDPSSAEEVVGRYRSGDPSVWEPIGRSLGAPSPERFAAQYGAYQASLARDRVVDYDDLVCLPLLLMLQRPEIGRIVAAQWRYVMVDEYQDTDFTQDHLLRILAAPHRNLCAVGDAAQAIYSWRQAKVENILTFAERNAPCRTIALDQNYRSTPDILDVANAVLVNRPEIGGHKTVLWTSAGGGPVPRVWTCMSQEAEANAVAEDIERALASSEISDYSEVLILYRLNALARAAETALQRRSIPYRVVNGTALCDRKEVRDLLAFLRVADNPFDQTSFERAAGAFSNGVGPSTIEALAGFARVTGRDLVTIASEADEDLGVRAQHAAALRGLGGLLSRIRAAGKEEGAGRALRIVLEETGIQSAIIEAAAEAEAEDDEEEMRRLDRRLHDIEDFLLYVEELGRRKGRDNDRLTISELLDSIALVSPSETVGADDAGPAVTLMTVHAAKGLEARRVYVVGLEEQVFPSHYGDEVIDGDGTANEHLAEEARLFYVAVTRAREYLILSAARTREIVRGDARAMIRSRFLASLPEMGYRPETHR